MTADWKVVQNPAPFPFIPCTYTEEELYEIVKERLQSIEDGSAILVDGEEVFSQIRERYGFKA